MAVKWSLGVHSWNTKGPVPTGLVWLLVASHVGSAMKANWPPIPPVR